MRTSPFVPWKTPLVCIVPPSVGRGWAKTTAAFGDSFGPSRMPSRRPAGPFNSTRTSGAHFGALGRLFDEAANQVGERVRLRDEANMSGALDGDVTGAFDEGHVFLRLGQIHHPVERR